MVVRDIPYTGLASFVGKPVDGLPVSFHGFLNNRVPFDSFVGALADVSTLLVNALLWLQQSLPRLY